MTSFSVDNENNLIAEVTGAFKEELIPVMEYIAVHHRLSKVFKEYLIHVLNKKYLHVLQRPINDIEYTSIKIDANTFKIFLSEIENH